MDLVKWSKEFEIGEKTIDEQHRELVSRYNKLLEICGSELPEAQKNKEIEKALEFLCLYTIQHFIDEEAIQLKCGFPGYEDHKQMHEDFKLKAFELCEKFKGWGYSYKFATILRSQIGQWVLSHIQDEDMKIGEFINQKA